MAGEINVSAMLRRITAKQLLEWEAYMRLEPFGEQRADWRAALVAQTVFNMAVVEEHRRPIERFLLTWKDEDTVDAPVTPKKQTWQEKKAIGYAIAMAYSVPAKELKK